MHRVLLEHDDTTAVVVVAGEVDAFVAPELEAAFEEARGAPLVVADLLRVSFLDSTALGVVVRACRAASDGTVRVVLPRGTARRIFEITALDRALPVYGSRQAAKDGSSEPS
jgi:anti-sigma B factor antagonist